MKTKTWLLGSIGIVLMASCSISKEKSDAYGTFEAEEITISAEVPGRLVRFELEEGQELKEGMLLGLIDTVDLTLKKEALEAQKMAAAVKIENIDAQAAIIRQQKENLLVEKERLEKLIRDKAATTKQMDEVSGNLKMFDKQMASTLIQKQGVSHELTALALQIEQVKESLKKCYLRCPVEATVLAKYAEPNELVTAGKPLYKIADLKEMVLRVYISGDQLPHVRIGQEVEVMIDQDKKTNQTLKGTVSWISANAEFTPKIIQTKKERVNLVYAVKIRVQNDGSLKIAMPGEVNFK